MSQRNRSLAKAASSPDVYPSSSLLRAITPQVWERWHADEFWAKMSCNMKYLFAMIDGEMRFILAREVADFKHRHNTRSLLKKVQ